MVKHDDIQDHHDPEQYKVSQERNDDAEHNVFDAYAEAHEGELKQPVMPMVWVHNTSRNALLMTHADCTEDEAGESLTKDDLPRLLSPGDTLLIGSGWTLEYSLKDSSSSHVEIVTSMQRAERKVIPVLFI